MEPSSSRGKGKGVIESDTLMRDTCSEKGRQKRKRRKRRRRKITLKKSEIQARRKV